MTKVQPLISVTLPNYNYGRFLREAIDSVLLQTYPLLEILFVDDGSTDDSRAIAEETARHDVRFKPIYFDRNQGVMKALDNAWSRATGEFIYQFSSDDALCDADFFQLGVAALAENEGAAGYYGMARTISAETGFELADMGTGLHEGFIPPSEFLRGFLNGLIFVPGISSLWRRRLIVEQGGYDSELGPQADYFINHALPAQYGVVFASRTFARTRVSEQRTSYSSSTTIDVTARRLVLFERKMRAATQLCPGQTEDWLTWRDTHLYALVLQSGVFHRWATLLKERLRMLLPSTCFTLLRICWRHTVGPVLHAAARLGSRYRMLANNWLEP